MPYCLRRATVADTDEIWSLLRETITWLEQLGTDQWSNWRTWGGPTGKVTRAIAAGSVWLVHNRRRLIATITVEPHGDPDFWTAEERAQPAIYISKLAVRRSHAGNGIGALLLDWARDLAHRQGAQWVRLDASRTNQRLRQYYIDQGWQFVREVEHPERISGALFQLPPSPLRPDQSRRLSESSDSTRRRRRPARTAKRYARWRPR